MSTSENLTPEAEAQLRDWQKAEITEHHIYLRLAEAVKDKHNAGILRQIGRDEASHYQIFKQ